VAYYHGVAGIAVDGCLRDIDTIAAMPLPVFCRGGGTKPYSEELMLTDINVPVEFAGAHIRPGDILVGDADGIVVIPAERIEDVLFQVGDIADIEAELEKGIKQKKPLPELAALLKQKHDPRPAR
jgi:4-hydroxy-4-methyl-2-oxoglutarate aldolase